MEIKNLEICSTERLGTLNFVLAVDIDGVYYAYREESPYFCFEGLTREDAIQTVADAVDFLEQRKNS